ncbi:MAG: hypothetical protein L0H31_04310 [Nocardioidaceae bacterium]|nr:hypothetical protein [Nocardioidaceae bacterium]
MLVLGVILLALGLLGLVLSFFGADIDYKHRSTEILNWDVSPGTLVLWGAASTLLILGGVWLIKVGAKHDWKKRKENKRLGELSEKLDRAEMERRRDDLSGREDS